MDNNLSKREMEVVELISLGLSKKEVAERLHRSTYTIETTIKNVYEKLHINKLSELVLFYCSKEFNIGFMISERKRMVLSSLLLGLVVLHMILSPADIQRARRISKTTRKSESEILIET